MTIRIVKKNEQCEGSFDNGLILERKPIAFPSEKSVVRPFSTLFYWAYAWSTHGGLIAEHPHRGFEICTFVLEGSISHYDNNSNTWNELQEGAAQVIRSGSGLRHAERLNAGTRIFQVWFDPNIKKSLAKKPTYDDYPVESFAVSESVGIRSQSIVGSGSPMRLESPALIRRLQFQRGNYSYTITPGHKSGIFILDGNISINEKEVEKNDFIITSDEMDISIHSKSVSILFVIEVPFPAPYETYAEKYQQL